MSAGVVLQDSKHLRKRMTRCTTEMVAVLKARLTGARVSN